MPKIKEVFMRVDGVEERIYPSSRRLPVAYQEVEWIGSSATQYINTGYTPTVDTEIETSLSRGGTQQAWGVFYGMTSADKSSDGILGRLYYDASSTGNVQTFNWWFCNSTYGEAQKSTSLDTFHTIISKKNYCSLDGETVTITTSGTPYQGNIYLFCGNNGGSAWRHTSVKFKTFKISESGELKRNFIPCYRKSDGVIGLYDLVGQQFYTNSGSGTFTKGADVNTKGYTPNSNTISRYRFINNLNDSSGNNRNLTVRSGTFTYGTTDGGAYYTILDRSQWTNYIDMPYNNTAYTVNIWAKGYTKTSSTWTIVVEYWGSGQNGGPRLSGGSSDNTLDFGCNAGWWDTADTNWHLCSITQNNGVETIYIDGQQFATGSSRSGSPSTVRFLLGNAGDTNSSTYCGYAYISDIINENRVWTADEISGYYNQTKGKYGL